ncbi:MAG: hypothetical protein KC419_17430 [Anaerolineales bacterium]|nr:hypothetical protein [Anaerolineales bacterium]
MHKIIGVAADKLGELPVTQFENMVNSLIKKIAVVANDEQRAHKLF